MSWQSESLERGATPPLMPVFSQQVLMTSLSSIRHWAFMVTMPTVREWNLPGERDKQSSNTIKHNHKKGKLKGLCQNIGRAPNSEEKKWEKGRAAHSSSLAWRIPWTEKPGRLQSMGSQRVRHDWATNTHTQELLRMAWMAWGRKEKKARQLEGIARERFWGAREYRTSMELEGVPTDQLFVLRLKWRRQYLCPTGFGNIQL